jgi:hypothetical protein
MTTAMAIFPPELRPFEDPDPEPDALSADGVELDDSVRESVAVPVTVSTGEVVVTTTTEGLDVVGAWGELEGVRVTVSVTLITLGLELVVGGGTKVVESGIEVMEVEVVGGGALEVMSELDVESVTVTVPVIEVVKLVDVVTIVVSLIEVGLVLESLAIVISGAGRARRSRLSGGRRRELRVRSCRWEYSAYRPLEHRKSFEPPALCRGLTSAGDEVVAAVCNERRMCQALAVCQDAKLLGQAVRQAWPMVRGRSYAKWQNDCTLAGLGITVGLCARNSGSSRR